MRADVAQGHLDEEDELSDEPNDNPPESPPNDTELPGIQPDTLAPADDLTIAQRLALRKNKSKVITTAQTQLVHTFLCDVAYSSLLALQASQCGL